MKRQRQHLDELVSKLSPVEASWLDDHALECIKLLKNFPAKDAYGSEDILSLMEKDFHSAATVFRLFLDVSKDEMTLRLKEALGPGGIGVKRFKQDRDKYLNALISLGLLEKISFCVHTPLHWSDVLVERLKGGRGSAIKGQQRGRGLEDFTEDILKKVFPEACIDPRCRFIGATGFSTEKADFAVPSRNDPHLLIEAKAYGATGSKQTDVLGDLHRIVEQKRHDTLFMLVTDGLTWRERLSDLGKLIDLQNQGLIHRIYTRAMARELFEDLVQFREESGL